MPHARGIQPKVWLRHGTLSCRITTSMTPEPASRFPELPAEVRNLTLLGTFKIFGPGVIIASVTIGSGETVFPSRSGALFGYSLLWCFALGTVIKGFQIYSGSRFMTLTGRHPLESWSELPGPRAWFVWAMTIMSLVCMPLFLGGGLPRMLADFTVSGVVGFTPAPGNLEEKQLFDLYACLWGTLFILVAITLTWLQSYNFLEKVQTVIIGLLLFSIFVAVLSSQPEVMAVLKGLVVPAIPTFEPWVRDLPEFSNRDPWVEVIVGIGVFGGGTQDYFGYLGLLREKSWGLMSRVGSPDEKTDWNVDRSPENVVTGKIWLRAPLIDVSFSFAAILFFALCFAVLGAVVLHPEHKVPAGKELLTQQLDFLLREGQSPLFQSFLNLLYKTGIFFAFFGTIHGAYELYTRTTHECLTVAIPRLRNVSLGKFRVATVSVLGVTGLTSLWCSLDPVRVITPAAIISSALTCGLWCFAMIWSDRTHLPAELRMKWPLVLAVILSGIALTIFGVTGLTMWLA